MGADCYCIRDIDSFVRRRNCSCVGCFKVWEHRLPEFGTADKSDKCIAARYCDDGILRRSYDKCDKVYDVICDNDAELGYAFQNYQTAAAEYVTEHLQPETCFKLDNDNEENKVDNCNEKLSFFCRFGTDEDKGDIILIPTISITKQEDVQSNNTGIAAGTVTSIIVLVVAIIVILILRRRLSKEKPIIHESQNSCPVQDLVELHINNETSQAAVYHEIYGGNFSPQYEILNRYSSVNSTSYDGLNLNRTPESENVYINTNNSAISILNSAETDRKFLEQKERVKQKKLNEIPDSSEVQLNINHESSQSATYHEIDNGDFSPQYEKLNNIPAVNSTPYDCLNLKRIPESEK
ncbi:unnamed protein product [Mytilus coruscus]|uniref:SRCR domain-containing protein n=1 Tax=Mytilus coruscus TaxID=42192 RepID=A0A6J8EX06_MYTCO|nr:unnamed protein product [Mytilus coruscus]